MAGMRERRFRRLKVTRTSRCNCFALAYANDNAIEFRRGSPLGFRSPGRKRKKWPWRAAPEEQLHFLRARVCVCVRKIDSKDCTSRTPGRTRDLDKKRDFYLGGASYCYDHGNIKRDYLATRSRLKRSPINIIMRLSSRAAG
jgi:hypothetical protein